MNQKCFSAKDLCIIIKALSDAGAKSFTLGDMSIDFMGQNTPDYLTDVAESPNNNVRSVPLEPITSHNDIEDDLTMKLLSDPRAFEEMVETE